MQISFFGSFAKKVNSTKAPLVTDATRTLTGYLIEPCSIMNPTFKIERFASDASPQSYTYAYISEFARFYFVEDWSWADGLWLCKLKEDVLASFKTQIANQTEYVLRTDSTTDFNGEITDTTYPATTDIETETYNMQNPFAQNISDGCYIVGVISGGQTDAVGAITYYVMTSAQFGALKEERFRDENLEIMGIIDSSGQQLVQDLSQEVLKTLYNPYQYIASCMWFPFPESLITQKTSVSTIKIGWWSYPLSGYRMYAQTVYVGESVNGIPLTTHPQSASRGSYLNYAPYTKRTLIGRFGTFAVDTNSYKSGDTIDIAYRIDLITGQCRTDIGRKRTINNTTTIDLLAQRDFLIGVPIQIAQVGTDYLGTAVSALGTIHGATQGAISGFFSGGIAGAVTGAISSSANGIYNTIQSAMPQVETSGSNGSFLSLDNNTRIVEQFFKIVDEDIHHRGRPLCELRQLGSLTGYILCAEGEIDLNCFDNERKEILQYLTTGFFME